MKFKRETSIEIDGEKCRGGGKCRGGEKCRGGVGKLFQIDYSIFNKILAPIKAIQIGNGIGLHFHYFKVILF